MRPLAAFSSLEVFLCAVHGLGKFVVAFPGTLSRLMQHSSAANAHAP